VFTYGYICSVSYGVFVLVVLEKESIEYRNVVESIRNGRGVEIFAYSKSASSYSGKVAQPGQENTNQRGGSQ
jgi:hypothetical protein